MRGIGRKRGKEHRIETFEPLNVLRQTRGLQGFRDEQLEHIANELRLVRYPDGHIFLKDFRDNIEAPMRVIVQGQVFWNAIANPDTAGAPTLDAGSIFGLGSVNTWARRQTKWRRMCGEDNPGFAAESHDDVWVLELPIESYHRAFAHPASHSVVSRLIGIYAARPYGPKLVRALRGTPEFSRVCPMHLSRVVESGVLERWWLDKPISISGKRKQMALRYVVSGQVRVTHEGRGMTSTYGNGELIPMPEIFSEEAPRRTFMAVGERPAEVVRIRRVSLDFTIRTCPGFARSLGPKTLESWIGEPSDQEPPYPVIASGEMTLVLADPKAEPLPLAQMIELLGQAMHEHLDDRETIVSLIPERLGQAPRCSPYGVPQTLVVPEGPGLRESVHSQLVNLAEHWGVLFDQILIDPSELRLDHESRLELMRAMVDLPCPSQISYLIESPEDWADLPERIGVVAGVHILPTVLLGPKPARLDIAKRFDTVKRNLGKHGIEGTLRRLRGAPQRRQRSWGEHALHVSGQLLDMPWSYPKPWPLEAIRLRLSDEVLAVLRACERPVDLHDVPLDTELVEPLREGFERWARAVTWRRVGIGIGGAGAQSYAAIPLIRRLRRAGIPIDVLSGSSTGAFISCFYSAYGDEGLELMIKQRYTFFAALVVDPYTVGVWELLLTALLEGVDLNDLELTVIAVAARAADGETVYLTSSLASRACKASGSVPPQVPIYIRNQRLLDGALTVDVPTAILTAAGAELIAGVQPYPRVNPLPIDNRNIYKPRFLRNLDSFNPLMRSLEFYRSLMMVVRQAARGDEPNADVIYEATTESSHAFAFYQGARVVEDAAKSASLDLAFEGIEAEWRRLKMRSPGRVLLNPDSGKFLLGNSTLIQLEGFVDSATGEIPQYARAIVRRIAAFMTRHAEFDLRAWLYVPPRESQDKVVRWRELLDQTMCAELDRSFELEVISHPKYRQVFLELGVKPREDEPEAPPRLYSVSD